MDSSVVIRCRDCGIIVSIKEVQEMRGAATQAAATSAATGTGASRNHGHRVPYRARHVHPAQEDR